MGLRITGADSTESMLRRLDSTGRRRVVRELWIQGKRLQNLAIRMAPRDEGNLENAIKISPESPERVRDAGGRFVRTEIEVYIDFMADAGAGHTVGEYAYEVHEHMFPMGYKQRGPGSLAKQAGQRETVGGGFMDRAAEEIEKGLDKALRDVLDGLI
jgi:hypothetical protein